MQQTQGELIDFESLEATLAPALETIGDNNLHEPDGLRILTPGTATADEIITLEERYERQQPYIELYSLIKVQGKDSITREIFGAHRELILRLATRGNLLIKNANLVEANCFSDRAFYPYTVHVSKRGTSTIETFLKGGDHEGIVYYQPNYSSGVLSEIAFYRVALKASDTETSEPDYNIYLTNVVTARKIIQDLQGLTGIRHKRFTLTCEEYRSHLAATNQLLQGIGVEVVDTYYGTAIIIAQTIEELQREVALLDGGLSEDYMITLHTGITPSITVRNSSTQKSIGLPLGCTEDRRVYISPKNDRGATHTLALIMALARLRKEGSGVV